MTDPKPAVRELSEFGDRLVSLGDGRKGLRAGVRVEVKADAQDPDVISIIASDETLDRYDEVISAAGWDLDNYRKNPVIQNAHNYWSIMDTLGRAETTEVVGSQLRQTWRFASEANPLARIARDMYRGGFLHACSVGFIPLEWETPAPPAPGKAANERPCRRRYLRQELLEVSAVGIPANPNALGLAVKSGAVREADLWELSQLLNSLCHAHRAGLESNSRAKGIETEVALPGVMHRLNEIRALTAAVAAVTRGALTKGQ